MDDVAARAGVSRAAVSLALQDSPKVSPARRAQIRQVAAELGYRPNSNASRLAKSRTGTIGVVLADLHNTLFAEMVDGLAAGLGDGPEQLLFATGFRDVRRERAAVESFLSHRVDGVVLLGSGLPIEEIQRLAQETPTIVVGRRVVGVDCVSVDDAAGAALATEHLLELGHRRIAHVDGGTGAGAALRSAEFLATMRRHGLGRQAVVSAGDYTEGGGRSAALALLGGRRPPTAIFAANDQSGLGVLAAAHRLRVAVPSALSVIGFDNAEISRSGLICLSTIDYPRSAMGQQALERLRQRIAEPGREPSTTVLAPQLLPRRTTSRPTGPQH